jgi:hypothetical protein
MADNSPDTDTDTDTDTDVDAGAAPADSGSEGTSDGDSDSESESESESIDAQLQAISEAGAKDGTQDIRDDVSAVKSQQGEIQDSQSEIKTQQSALAQRVSAIQDSVNRLGHDHGGKDHVYLAEQGVAMDGSEPADEVLEEFDTEGMVLHAEDGDIRIDTWTPRSAGLELTGQGARLLPTERSEPLSEWLYFDADRFLLEGFTFDFRTCAYPPKAVFDAPNWTMRNCTVRGSMGLPETPTGSTAGRKQAGRGYSFLFCPTGGVGLIQNCAFPDGGADPDGNGNRFGFISNLEKMSGTLIYDGVYMAGWPNNTIYHHNIAARLEIRNSFFRNTNAGIRVGGDTLLTNTTWVRDGPVPGQRWTNPDNPGSNMRGVWTTGGDKGSKTGYAGTVRIEDCDFLMADGDGWATGATAVRCEPAVERLEVVDTRIDWAGTSARNPIRVGFRDSQSEDRTCTVRLKNIHIRNRKPVEAIWIEDESRVTLEHISGTVRNDADGGSTSAVAEISDALDGGDPDPVDISLSGALSLPDWVEV